MKKIFIVISSLLLIQSCTTYMPDTYTSAFGDKEKETESSTLDESDSGLEYFECKDYSKLHWNNIIINLIADFENNTGSVIVSGVEYEAYYTVKGIQRLWYFGFSDVGKPAYAIALKPNGIAFYFNIDRYDDADNINSSDIFECREE